MVLLFYRLRVESHKICNKQRTQQISLRSNVGFCLVWCNHFQCQKYCCKLILLMMCLKSNLQYIYSITISSDLIKKLSHLLIFILMTLPFKITFLTKYTECMPHKHLNKIVIHQFNLRMSHSLNVIHFLYMGK